MPRQIVFPLALALGGSLISAAVVRGGSEDKVSSAIKQALESRFPDRKFLDVRPGPVPGLYEIFTGDAIVYADESADHLFVGSWVDTRTHVDLTAERLSARQVVDFEALPFDLAIKTTRGSGRRHIAVFTDPDCPYCQQLEHSLREVRDVTVHTFLYPIAELHPQAADKARAIWCSPNRSKAWQEWMLEKQLPQAAACKEDPIDELRALAAELHISGTPTIILPNGRRVVDTPKAERIEALLEEAAGSPERAKESVQSATPPATPRPDP